MNEQEWMAQQFEENRRYLRAVAYRILGSLSEADDAVQESWLRLSRSNSSSIENLRGWLTTVTARVCLDALRSRKSRSEVPLGPHVPEPILSRKNRIDPEQEALLGDSIGLALLVVLETLAPTERLAFVLHDMFAVPFDEIAGIVGRSPDAARQLASRARRRVQGATPDIEADLGGQRAVVDAFLAASRAGDFEALVAVLDPDVVFRHDAGRRTLGVRSPVEGSTDVARRVLSRGTRIAPFARPVLVNGAAGVVVGDPARPFAVVGFTVAAGRIVEIDLITNPAKLRRLRLA